MRISFSEILAAYTGLRIDNYILTAEEGGSGKVILLENGAYKEMDACLM